MCVYCKNKKKNAWLARSDDKFSGVEAKVVTIDGSAYLAVSGWYDGWSGGAVGIEQRLAPIRFCPMCGRKFEG